MSTVRYGRAPEYKKKTLTEQLDAELVSMVAVCPDLQLVALADGAEENWRFARKGGMEVRMVSSVKSMRHLGYVLSPLLSPLFPEPRLVTVV